jgi:AcrR family transcriptional regulator
MIAQTRTKEAVRRARDEAYRSLILDAAERVFAERGYADARMQEIAEEAGVATGTLYGSFPSKRELYRAVHRVNLEELAERYAGIPEHLSCRETILERLAVSTRFLTSRPGYLRIYLREAGRWGLDPGDLPPGPGAFVTPDLYRRGVEDGELVDEDPELLTAMALALNQVLLDHWQKRGGGESPDALIERIQAHYARALFRS